MRTERRALTDLNAGLRVLHHHRRRHASGKCDGEDCLESLETDTESFEVALGKMRRASWQESNIAGQWFHFCPECDVDI